MSLYTSSVTLQWLPTRLQRALRGKLTNIICEVKWALSCVFSWGVPFANYLTGITLVNRAVSGRSARSYWREKKWADVQALLKAGDCKHYVAS